MLSDVTSLLSSLSNLQADDFVDSVLTPAPKITATISVGDVQLRFSEVKGQGQIFCTNFQFSSMVELQGWHAKQLLKHKKEHAVIR